LLGKHWFMYYPESKVEPRELTGKDSKKDYGKKIR
jgi:hypothetical protein